MYPNYPNYQNFPNSFPVQSFPVNSQSSQVPRTTPNQFQVAQNGQFQNYPNNLNHQTHGYPQAQTNNFNHNSQPQLNSADKRNKILELYKIVFGRIPQESDISALLINNLTELELIKKMLNSEEHLEILKARNEVINSRIENEKVKKEMEDIKARQIDLENTNKSWEELVSEKSEEMRKVDEERKALTEKVGNMRKRIEDYEVRLNKPMWRKIWDWVKKVVGR